MLFNSFQFFAFLAITFVSYWLIFGRSWRAQNVLLLVASYFFYGCWDWRFLGLIAVSSIGDFFFAQAIDKADGQTKRKIYLWLSLTLNLGILGFFKYFNFFVDSLADLFNSLGWQINTWSLNVILPVGISFYTFQTLSYTIDVYRGKLKPTNDIVSFLAFVSFFPQLVAGPIERATNLLPQFTAARSFKLSEAKDGLRQILWGLSKKLLIADSCGVIANEMFGAPNQHSSVLLMLGAFFFAFQIYGDFSGYSDVAIGTGKLFGFRLMKNFNCPYFSRDIAEFWRRWHISLSTWFRDYVYIPLGGSQVQGKWTKIRNVMAVFLLSGLWHGANWTFVFWGLLNALLFIPLFLSGNNRRFTKGIAEGRWLPSVHEVSRIALTFSLVCFCWVFFRAESIGKAFEYLGRIIVNEKFFTMPRLGILETGFYVTILILIEWIHREREHSLEISYLPIVVRWIIYMLLGLLVLNGIFGGSEEFIYFQF